MVIAGLIFYGGMVVGANCGNSCSFSYKLFTVPQWLVELCNNEFIEIGFPPIETVGATNVKTPAPKSDDILEIEIPSTSRPYTEYVGIAFANNQGKAEKLAQKLSSSAQFTDVGRTLGYKDALSLVPESVDSIQVACKIGEKDKLFTGTDKSDVAGLKCTSGIITYSKTYANGIPSN